MGLGVWVLEWKGKLIMPMFDSPFDAEEFMSGWQIDRDEFFVGPGIPFSGTKELARDAKNSGVKYWAFKPSPNPDKLIHYSPMSKLIEQAEMFEKMGR